MTFDDYFKIEKLYKSIADDINASSKMLSSFGSALEQVSNVSKYRGLLGLAGNNSLFSAGASLHGLEETALPYQTAVVGSALKDSFKFEGAAKLIRTAYEPMFEQQRMLEEAQSSVRSLIESQASFTDRLKTSVYIRPVGAVSGVEAALRSAGGGLAGESLPGMTSALTAVQSAMSGVDKNYNGAIVALEQVGAASRSVSNLTSLTSPSWLKEDSPWRTAIDQMTKISSNLADSTTASSNSLLIKLYDAENETARLLERTRVSTEITSAAAQLASIVKAEEDTYNTGGLINLITGYNKFALDQHKQIQDALNAGRDKDADWRLDLLESTSKFVDRQVIQDGIVSDKIEDILDRTGYEEDVVNADYQEIEKDYDDYEPIIQDNSVFFTLISQSVGYSKRADSKVGLEEALGKSDVISITELGFGIVNRILKVNELQTVLFEDNVFRATDKNMWTIGNLGQFICDDSDKFETLMKSIYSLIYENQNGIKKMLGNGDAKAGDEIMRGDEYKCIFRIKDIRTDLEHDIQHGKEKDQKKKQKEIDDAYRFYFKKKKPTTAKEFKTFQINLYKDIINLIDRFILIISERIKEGEDEDEADSGGESL